MSTELKAGGILELQCPDNSRPQVNIGDRLPSTKPKFVVLGLHESSVTLGPLEAGSISADISCSNGSVLKAEATLQPDSPKNNEGPKVLAPFALAYPLWFWILLILFITALIGTLLTLWYRFYKKQQALSQLSVDASVFDHPERNFHNFLSKAASRVQDSQGDLRNPTALYSEANDLLRGYLEYKFSFKAKWATSAEYIATLRPLLQSYAGAHEAASLVESVLSQSDLVRFSKQLPDAGTSKFFIENLKKISQIVTRATQQQNSSGPGVT